MRKALIVGINDYASAPLKACTNDANAIATVLETHGDGAPNFAIKLHTSPGTTLTRSSLRKAIEELFTGDSDISLFYFSGHGFVKSTGGYIVTTDFKKYDEGISMDDILKIANSSPAKERVIILDCCHSGALGSPSLTGMEASFLKDGMTILTACRDSESAMEANGSSIFTALVTDALQGGAADLRGYITPGSIYAYVDQALGPWDQRPVFKTNVSKFTSLRNVKPPVPIATLRKIAQYFKAPQDELKLDPSFEFTEPSANPANVTIFKDLQKFASVGLVVPVGEEYMYFAALHSKSCRLTALGFQYWRLVTEKKL